MAAVADRQSLVLLGHNGAGKSTLIRYLLGYYPDRGGHPFLAGWSDIEPLDRRALGYVPEFPYLDPNLSGAELFRMMARLKGTRFVRRDAEAAVRRIGLEAEVLPQRIGRYSKGMRQRLMLAVALSGEPEILVLDEPLSGLDPFGRREIVDLLQELRSRCRLILSTHSLDDAWHLADTVWLLRQGEFVYRGPRPESLDALHALYFDHPPLPVTA